jgi:DNA-binding transcriptional MerR regulator
MSTSDKTQSKFKDWYSKNKDELNKSRRERYAGSLLYRERVKERNRRARLKKKRERIKEAKRRQKAVKIRLSKSWKTVKVEVDGVEVQMYTIGALAKVLGKGISTLRIWEKNGILPETPYQTERGERLYTLEMVEIIRKELQKSGKLGSEQKGKGRLPFVVREVQYISGKRARLKLYRIGVLAKAVRRTAIAINQMEKRGVFPKTPLFASSLKYRLYTYEMINVARKAFESRGGLVRGLLDWRDLYLEVLKGWTELGVMDAKVVE